MLGSDVFRMMGSDVFRMMGPDDFRMMGPGGRGGKEPLRVSEGGAVFFIGFEEAQVADVPGEGNFSFFHRFFDSAPRFVGMGAVVELTI